MVAEIIKTLSSVTDSVYTIYIPSNYVVLPSCSCICANILYCQVVHARMFNVDG